MDRHVCVFLFGTAWTNPKGKNGDFDIGIKTAHVPLPMSPFSKLARVPTHMGMWPCKQAPKLTNKTHQLSGNHCSSCTSIGLLSSGGQASYNIKGDSVKWKVFFIFYMS